MPYRKEKVNGPLTPTKDFSYPGGYENAIVVVSNLVARAVTTWTLEESKLFMLAVSQIENRDKECCVKLRKRDVLMSLGIDPKDSYKNLRNIYTNVMLKSNIEFVGPGKDDWERGQLISRVRTDRYFVYITFAEYYLDLLHYVKDELYLRCELQTLLGLRHQSGYNLYLYLASWSNVNYAENTINIDGCDLPKVFNLAEGQYWRNWGKEGKNPKFDWAHFEKRCLIPGVEDINNNKNCDMYVTWKKIKDDRNMKTIVGYSFKWKFQNPDGSPKLRGAKLALPDPSKVLNMEERNEVQYFMQHFRKLDNAQLEYLSNILGLTGWNGQPAWSINQLQQEQKMNCISQKFYDDLRRKIGWDTANYDLFAQALGYKNSEDELQAFMNSFDIIGKKYRIENQIQ